jgi:hypothetical protein
MVLAALFRALLLRRHKRSAQKCFFDIFVEQKCDLFSGRRASLIANPLDHRAQAVGALRREMFGKAEIAENRRGIERDDLPRRTPRKEREDEGDEAAHDQRVAVAAKRQHRRAGGVMDAARIQPDLADAAAHAIFFGAGGLRQWLQRAAKLDQIAIAILPIVEKFEIADDLVDIRRHSPPRLLRKS